MLVWFGDPIEPVRVDDRFATAAGQVTDPLLDVDELPGLLVAWQRRVDGWWGMVESTPTRITVTDWGYASPSGFPPAGSGRTRMRLERRKAPPPGMGGGAVVFGAAANAAT